MAAVQIDINAAQQHHRDKRQHHVHDGHVRQIILPQQIGEDGDDDGHQRADEVDADDAGSQRKESC